MRKDGSEGSEKVLKLSGGIKQEPDGMLKEEGNSQECGSKSGGGKPRITIGEEASDETRLLPRKRRVRGKRCGWQRGSRGGDSYKSKVCIRIQTCRLVIRAIEQERERE